MFKCVCVKRALSVLCWLGRRRQTKVTVQQHNRKIARKQNYCCGARKLRHRRMTKCVCATLFLAHSRFLNKSDNSQCRSNFARAAATNIVSYYDRLYDTRLKELLPFALMEKSHRFQRLIIGLNLWLQEDRWNRLDGLGNDFNTWPYKGDARWDRAKIIQSRRRIIHFSLIGSSCVWYQYGLSQRLIMSFAKFKSMIIFEVLKINHIGIWEIMSVWSPIMKNI